jgi:hypothetical protein
MAIEFRVQGLPPKKTSETSLWQKEVEVPRVILLRRSALKAIGTLGPYRKDIRLRVHLFLRPIEYDRKNFGDLDNFASGICDALQAANSQPKHLHPKFLTSDNRHIHPSISIAMENDALVTSLLIEKHILESEGTSFYTVILEGFR